MKIKGVAAMLLGWAVPGLGHAVQKNYVRAVLFFVAIFAMTGLGLAMGGKIYPMYLEKPRTVLDFVFNLFRKENPLTILAFFADLGNGLFYAVARLQLGRRPAGAPPSSSTALHRRGGTAQLPGRARRVRHRGGEEEMIFESLLLSMVVYAFFVALVLALIRRDDTKARLKYGLVLFAVMTVGAVAFGWFMFLFIKK
jgi:hypothetical protein